MSDPSRLLSQDQIKNFIDSCPAVGGSFHAKLCLKCCAPDQSAILRIKVKEACTCVDKAFQAVAYFWEEILATKKSYAYIGSLAPLFDETNLEANRRKFIAMARKFSDACTRPNTLIGIECLRWPATLVNCTADRYAFVPFKGDLIYVCPLYFEQTQSMWQSLRIWHEFGRYFLWDELPKNNEEVSLRDVQVWDKMVDIFCRDYDSLAKQNKKKWQGFPQDG